MLAGVVLEQVEPLEEGPLDARALDGQEIRDAEDGEQDRELGSFTHGAAPLADLQKLTHLARSGRDATPPLSVLDRQASPEAPQPRSAGRRATGPARRARRAPWSPRRCRRARWPGGSGAPGPRSRPEVSAWLITQANGVICARARSPWSRAASCTGVASGRVTSRMRVNSGSRSRGSSSRTVSGMLLDCRSTSRW